jgi:hypothetical protein
LMVLSVIDTAIAHQVETGACEQSFGTVSHCEGSHCAVSYAPPTSGPRFDGGSGAVAVGKVLGQCNRVALAPRA